ncbi:proline dehydrogenase family protein [Halobacterium sp. R2-5]|uniref:proline dehydrogenase family protein n=1 Tax=Halobacterium sp. R2-5 TaxID=2715751 RepID=UPI0014247641|nr:proline dehydrogenase family protein [Halobacterium sp. R2-5]NIB99704.1 proline dehydrogenase [Halobacterium sp. R2-5]
MIPPIASKFVAGETPAEAVEHAGALNDRGVEAILNLLGEHYEERPPADEDAAAYEDLVRDIDSSGVDACISVKPSQIGLDVGDDVFAENLAGIVEVADEHGVFTWVDMENHETTDATLDAYEDLTTEYGGGVGVCIQANLKRTKGDLERLAGLPGKVRLVKGAYDEPKSIAYKRKERVNEAYRDYLEYMFREFEGGIGVGSHDPGMIAHARDLHDEYGTDYEVQMLMGVRDDAQVDLAADGVTVYQYVPYGDKWFSYFYRRAMERKENMLFALRAVLGR